MKYDVSRRETALFGVAEDALDDVRDNLNRMEMLHLQTLQPVHMLHQRRTNAVVLFSETYALLICVHC